MRLKDPTFSILITTKNRLNDLQLTLKKINRLIETPGVECVIFDDGSNDGTFDFVKNNYPNIVTYKNKISKGYLFCRNKMLNNTNAAFAISLDDDAHFLTKNPLEIIKNYFDKYPACGVIASRIFWGLKSPKSAISADFAVRVQGFVGCGHVWNMKAWKSIPNYPSWFVFYGEENYASFQLFKKGWEVHYVPEILVHHRVDIKGRKKDKDYQLRLRRSLRSGWYLFFLFYPWNKIPRRFAYTLWIQIKNKVLKGDLKAALAILQALGDVLINSFRFFKYSNRLTKEEFNTYLDLPNTKLYWVPKKNQ